MDASVKRSRLDSDIALVGTRVDQAPAAPPSVTVVIPSLNTRDLLEVCLLSLARQTAWPECEAIVVDMSSSDGTVEMVARLFPDVRLYKNVPNKGYGAACNFGALHALGERLLLVNSDVDFHRPEALADLLAHADSWTGDALFGVRLVGPDGAPQRSAHGRRSRWSLPLMFFAPLRYIPSFNSRAMGHLDEAALIEDTAVGWVTGALLLLRLELFRRLEGFDEAFFMNSEEVDLAARLIAIGGSVVYVPQVVVVHYGGGSTTSSKSSLGWLAESQARYTRKHFGVGWLALAKVAAIAAYATSIPVWVLRVLLRRQRPIDVLSDVTGFARALGCALHS